jgi:8-oxo-dGTP pyrophosphatase MutT (NUDIX family)
MTIPSLPISVQSVGAIIRLPGARFLFQLRDDDPNIVMPGRWGLFGGHVEDGEGFDHAILRELAEELGLTGRPIRAASELAFPRPHGWVHRKLYEVRIDDGDLVHLELREGADMRVMSALDFLGLDNIVYWDAFALAHVLTGKDE